MLHKFILALGCVVTCMSTVQAHVTLEQKSAVARSGYKAIFRVGHGCDGSPTTAITVFLPEGFVGAKPMPKAGWSIDRKTEKLDTPYDSHGTAIFERTAQLSWRGGRLLDNEYDEFVVNLTLPATVGKHWVRVLQECEKGQTDWAMVPVDGEPRPRYPAAALETTAPPKTAGHEHSH